MILTLNLVTAAPTVFTEPATSAPGMYGKLGFIECVPVRMYVSTGLIPDALTSTNT